MQPHAKDGISGKPRFCTARGQQPRPAARPSLTVAQHLAELGAAQLLHVQALLLCDVGGDVAVTEVGNVERSA